ncbi:enoyl-CoA hydratase/isomerase [Chryseobacterium sp. MYb328]|uniref:enoyl-CoA hydratase/isomerase n=1 Tax=Chryseobacterium sp. MYb328 TaxID=2745231 RepID=UPI0030A14AA0
MNGYNSMTGILQTVFSTVKLRQDGGTVTIRIDRPEAQNSINSVLLSEMRSILTGIEENTEIKVVILEGANGIFCTGMDFRALTSDVEGKLASRDSEEYYELLKQFSSTGKIIVSKVDGRVNAGGIGLVAASDIVIASERSTFALSEALFGLLPACVLPYLIRRIGYQKALMMTLTTQVYPCERAYELGLIDVKTNDPDNEVRKLLLRLTKLEAQTIKGAKNYLEKLWIIDEQTKQLAVNTISELAGSDQVQTTIKNYLSTGRFPWEGK